MIWASPVCRENYTASSWRCSMIAKTREPHSLPSSSRSTSGTKSLPIPPWPMPSWIGWSTTPTGSNSKVNRCAKAKTLLRKMKIKVRQSQARLFGRGSESVTRSDRRERELEFESSFPPLTARPNRRREDVRGLATQSSPLGGAPNQHGNDGKTLTPVGHPFMIPSERRFAPTTVRQARNGVRYGLEQVSAFIGIRSTRVRWESAVKSKAFDTIRKLVVLETRAEHFLRVLETGGVSTNSYLRRIHGFALDMNWLPWPVLARKQWPALRFKEKRAITWEEHHKILAGESNPAWRGLYQFLWCLGGAQTDIATLRAEDVDWADRTISYPRQKTGTMSLIRFADSVAEILQRSEEH